MRVAQVSQPGGPLELVERPIPEPGPRHVRIRVEACGICHSDSFCVEGQWPGIVYPKVPGHEIAGVIDSLGADVEGWSPGQRVGVGWHGGHCFRCAACRRGDFVLCAKAQVPGLAYDGGYAEYMIAPEEALASIPHELTAEEAGPLLCAGITTFNALRNSGASPGDLVAILGIGGLGHLGVQFAAKMGFNTVAIARGAAKEPLSKKLGAHHYIDSQAGDPGAALKALGGAKVILSTVTNNPAIAAVIPGLGRGGKLVIVGVGMEPLEVNTMGLIGGRASVGGWPSGTAVDSEDTLNFSALTGVRSRNEVYPLDQVQAAYDRMMSGKAQFRVVLKIS